jgi:acyl-phosphate glycerol 3-phosphate acyltransferase
LASVVLVVLAYLIGSASFAVIVSSVFGLPDPRSYGSGNPGATNVLRSGKKTAAALTLTGDVMKGMIAVWLAKLLAPEVGAGAGVVPLAGLAAFLGHLYPVFFRFQGGKGVATAAGILFAFSVPVGLTVMVAWAAMFWATDPTRQSSWQWRCYSSGDTAPTFGSCSTGPRARSCELSGVVQTAVLRVSRSHRGRTAKPCDPGAAPASRKAPTRAIMAPLSVQNSRRG